MSNIVDAISAEFATSEPAVVEHPEPKVAEDDEHPKTEIKEDPKPDEPFEGSKKEANALSKQKSKNASLKRQIAGLEAKIARFEQLKSVPAPSMDNFQDWDSYEEAKGKHRIELGIAESRANDAKESLATQESDYVSERQELANQAGADFEKNNPNGAKLIEQHIDVIKALPDGIKKAILESDNAPLVLHNLINDGMLSELAAMSELRAAIEIGKAQSKPIAIKKETNAPAPMAAARGSVNAGFNWQAMSPDDLLKSIRKG